MTTLERVRPDRTVDETSTWWDCPDCGVEAELREAGARGCAAPCPDCGGRMVDRGW